MKNKKPSYGEASSELEAILAQIEEGQVDIDELSEKVERAAELIRLCREKLAATEVKVKKIVQEMSAEADPGKAPGGPEAEAGEEG